MWVCTCYRGRHQGILLCADACDDAGGGINDIRSFQFDISSFTGGAHPNHAFVSRTYDFAGNKEITLADLFKHDSGYLEFLSQVARGELSQSLYCLYWSEEVEDSEDFSMEMLRQGTTPELENFKHFRLTERELIIAFESYQVAPYALGSPEIEIHFAGLQEYLNEDFLNY